MISGVTRWIAFGLLAFVGSRKIYESLFGKKQRHAADRVSTPMLLMLSIASSIDALAVGFSLSLLKVNIFLAAAVFGIATFTISILGVFVGKEAGKFIGNKVGIIGGIIIIGIAFEILLSRQG